MKLTNLRRLRGREWLWRNDQIPLALPKQGASYAETADSGGWDECFPTVAVASPGAPPGRRPAGSRRALECRVDQLASTTMLAGPRWPARRSAGRSPTSSIARSRWIRVDPALRVRYRLRHTW